MLYTFFICFVAGIGAGLGTGFAGMSAAADIPAYTRIPGGGHRTGQRCACQCGQRLYLL